MSGEDSVAEPGGEPFDLGLDLRGGVAGVAGGDVGVRVRGVHVAVRARWIGEVLLAHEHVRRIGHPPGVEELLAGGDLLEATAHVHRAGPARGLVGPRDSSLHGVVDFEGPGTVAVAGQRARDPARHPIAGDPRRRGGRDVEHDDVRRTKLVQGLAPVRRSRTVHLHPRAAR